MGNVSIQAEFWFWFLTPLLHRISSFRTKDETLTSQKNQYVPSRAMQMDVQGHIYCLKQATLMGLGAQIRCCFMQSSECHFPSPLRQHTHTQSLSAIRGSCFLLSHVIHLENVNQVLQGLSEISGRENSFRPN